MFNSSSGDTTTLPVTLRSMIDVRHGGAFSGVLTGGNGRGSAHTGQQDYYEFQVKHSEADITANVDLTNDTGDNVGAYLIDPNGNVAGVRPELDQRHQRQVADGVRGQPDQGHLDPGHRLPRPGRGR